MLGLERIEREDVAMLAVGRPRTAIAAAEAGNLEGDEIAVELDRARRDAAAPLAPSGEAPDRCGDVEDQPMGEGAREIELLRQVGIGDRRARSCACRPARRSTPSGGETLLSSAKRAGMRSPGANVGRAQREAGCSILASGSLRLGRRSAPSRSSRLRTHACASATARRAGVAPHCAEHGIQDGVRRRCAAQNSAKIAAVAKDEHAGAKIEELLDLARQEDDRVAARGESLADCGRDRAWRPRRCRAPGRSAPARPASPRRRAPISTFCWFPPESEVIRSLRSPILTDKLARFPLERPGDAWPVDDAELPAAGRRR